VSTGSKTFCSQKIVKNVFEQTQKTAYSPPTDLARKHYGKSAIARWGLNFIGGRSYKAQTFTHPLKKTGQKWLKVNKKGQKILEIMTKDKDRDKRYVIIVILS